jgi:tetratricopeptide (TPR) repeat protein
MRYGGQELKALVADTKFAAIGRLREAVCGELKAGRRRTFANILFDLLQTAVTNGAGKDKFISSPLSRERAAGRIHSTIESSTFKSAISRFEKVLASCRPFDSTLMPEEENRLGVACVEAVIERRPCVLIVRGPTSEARGSTPDTMLRLVAEFRFLDGGPIPDFLWNLPQVRNFVFTGREDYFEALGLQTDRLSPPIDVLVGLGGVGKSHIAIEYAYRLRPDFDVIWWIRGADPSTLQADYHTLAKALKLADGTTPTPEAVLRVQAWLETHDRWMLIIDSAEGPLTVQDVLPRAGTGRIVITSLNPDWRSLGIVHEVRPFSNEEASAFLERRSGVTHPGASDLAHELGYLPLALEHAAAYIQAAGTGYAEYLQLYRAHRAQLLRDDDSHLSPIVTTWKISIDRVERDNDLAVDLLNLASCMASAPIPRVSFERAHAMQYATMNAENSATTFQRDEQQKGNNLAITDAITQLRRYSLVDAHVADVTVHRLLQDVVWENMSPDLQYHFASLALAVVAELFAQDRYRYHDSELANALLPHVLSVTAPSQLASTAAAVNLTTLFGLFLYDSGNFALALTALERSRDRMQELEENSAVKLTALNCLAMVCRALGRDSDAEATITQGLRLVSNFSPSSSEEIQSVVSFLNTAAVHVSAAGQGELALEMLEHASELMRGQYIRPELISLTLANIGANLVHTGHAGQAIEHLKLAIDLAREFVGDAHPLIASHLNSLGAAYREARQLPKAREALHEAWRIQLDAHGDRHPMTVYQAAALGEVLLALGLDQEALEICGDDLSSPKSGTYHPIGLTRWHSVRGVALTNLSRYEEALAEISIAIDLAGELSDLLLLGKLHGTYQEIQELSARHH